MKKSTVVTAIFCFIVNTVFAQSDYDIMQVWLYEFPQLGSARAHSMGGVYVSTNQGVESILGNPAGLSSLSKTEYIFDGSSLLTGSIDDEDYYKANGYVSSSNTIKLSPQINHLAVAFPISAGNEQWIGSVAYRGLYNNGNLKYEEELKDEFGFIEKEKFQVRGGVGMLSLGAARPFGENLSIGFSYNRALSGKLKSTTESEVVPPPNTNYEKESSSIELESDVTGFSFFQIGALYEASPQLTLGFSMISSHEIEIEDNKYKFEIDQNQYSGTLSDTKIEVPMLYSFGAGYQYSDNLLFVAQMDNLPWENVEIDGYEYSEENGTAYRFGLEYTSGLIWRAGYAVRKEDFTDVDDDPVYSRCITGGVGLQTDQFMIDAGLEYYSMSYDYGYDMSMKTIALYLSLKKQL